MKCSRLRRRFCPQERAGGARYGLPCGSLFSTVVGVPGVSRRSPRVLERPRMDLSHRTRVRSTRHQRIRVCDVYLHVF